MASGADPNNKGQSVRVKRLRVPASQPRQSVTSISGTIPERTTQTAFAPRPTCSVSLQLKSALQVVWPSLFLPEYFAD
jgi:hypothetical protein